MFLTIYLDAPGAHSRGSRVGDQRHGWRRDLRQRGGRLAVGPYRAAPYHRARDLQHGRVHDAALCREWRRCPRSSPALVLVRSDERSYTFLRPVRCWWISCSSELQRVRAYSAFRLRGQMRGLRLRRLRGRLARQPISAVLASFAGDALTTASSGVIAILWLPHGLRAQTKNAPGGAMLSRALKRDPHRVFSRSGSQRSARRWSSRNSARPIRCTSCARA